MITYTLLNPTGNMTLLAETPVPEASQPLIADALMALEPEAEQVGFVSFLPDCVQLRMAGGEFCGNASMSAATLFMERSGRSSGTVSVQVSGLAEPVTAVMTPLADAAWKGTVSMPRPQAVRDLSLPGAGILPVVQFPGISHVILEEEMDPSSAEALAPVWCSCLGAEALGLMFLDAENRTLKPLVYVPAAGTIFWETSCASGTTAAGVFLARRAGKAVRLSLTQPGGTLEISADPDRQLLLTGTVRTMHRASADIALPPQ